MKLSQDAPLWIGVMGLALAGVLGGWLPIVNRGRSIEQAIAGLESELAKPTDSPERINKLRAQVARLEERGRGRTAVIPKDHEVAKLVQDLSASLDTLDLVRREITTGSPRQVDQALSLPVTVMVSGDFGSLVSLLREIEQSPRLVRVDRLKLGPASRTKSEEPADRMLRADVVLNAFYLGANTPTQANAGAKESTP